MPNLIGEIILNRYRVDDLIGRGGMAEVYKVWDQQRAAHLAMKLLREDMAEDKVFLRRFRREAQTLAKLQHPHIVTFYGLEQEGALAFMLLDYVEGISLRREIFDAPGPLPDSRIRKIMQPICSALHYAHNMGMVHCDLKPGNIMVHKNGTVLVTDFGIARMTDAATATMVGAGTPAYMAPEQARGFDPTPQTDIYALGVVLFEMLTGGERPFVGEQATVTGSTSEKVRWDQINLNPPSPRRWNSEISDELETVVLQCLAKDPAERYTSPLDLLNALELALPPGLAEIPAKVESKSTAAISVSTEEPQVSKESEEPKEITSPLPADEKPRQRGTLALLALLGIIALIAGVGLFMLGRGGEGLLGKLAAVTETATVTPTVTASAFPTITATPRPSATGTPSPSVTFTNTASPTDTPLPSLTPTTVPSNTPSATQIPTQTEIPEGYVIVPDVIGQDAYKAVLQLGEIGFEVKQVAEYNPDIPKNQVVDQQPVAGSFIDPGEKVILHIAASEKLMLSLHVPANIGVAHYSMPIKMSEVELPEQTWCQANLINEVSFAEHSGLTVTLYHPEYDFALVECCRRGSLAYVSTGGNSYTEFKTTSAGSYQIGAYSGNKEADFYLFCRPIGPDQ